MSHLVRALRLIGRGLRRLVGAPGLWVGCWLLLLAMAWVVGQEVQSLVAAALGPFDVLDLDRVVFGVASVLRTYPELQVGALASVLGGTLVAALGWLVVSPLVIARLAGHTGLRELGARGLGALPAVVVQSLWHAVLRTVLVAAVLMSAQPLPGEVIVALVVVVWMAAGVALDATRVAVVEHGAAPWHIKTAWRGLVRAAKRPRVLVPGVLLGVLQLGVSLLIVWLALAGLGSSSAWVPRGLALVSVGLGLWRIAIVVDDAASDGGDDGPRAP